MERHRSLQTLTKMAPEKAMCTQTKHRNTNRVERRKTMKPRTGIRMSFILMILVLLPYSSTLSLPSGDPAPGRSPGPPEPDDDETTDLRADGTVKIATNIEPDYDTSTTIDDVELTTVSDFSFSQRTVGDACAFSSIPSDSDDVVTIASGDSDVNLTVSHPVFEAVEIIRGVVYDEVIIENKEQTDSYFGALVKDYGTKFLNVHYTYRADES